MRQTKEKMKLPCILTEAELLNFGQEMATGTQAIAEKEGDLKAFSQRIKSEII